MILTPKWGQSGAQIRLFSRFLSLETPQLIRAHWSGSLTCPPSGWRAVAYDWIASSSCIFCVNTYKGKYSAFLSKYRSVLHRGTRRNPPSHIFLPSSQLPTPYWMFQITFFQWISPIYIFPIACAGMLNQFTDMGTWAERDSYVTSSRYAAMQCGKCSK